MCQSRKRRSPIWIKIRSLIQETGRCANTSQRSSRVCTHRVLHIFQHLRPARSAIAATVVPCASLLDRFKCRGWNAEEPRILRRSFSAVSRHIFANKYSLCNSFRYLQVFSHVCTAESSTCEEHFVDMFNKRYTHFGNLCKVSIILLFCRTDFIDVSRNV